MFSLLRNKRIGYIDAWGKSRCFIRLYGKLFLSFGLVTPQMNVTAMTPQGKGTTPQAGRATPQAGRATPQAERATPQAERPTPQAERVTPQAERATPQAERATPQPKKLTPPPLLDPLHYAMDPPFSKKVNQQMQKAQQAAGSLLIWML